MLSGLILILHLCKSCTYADHSCSCRCCGDVPSQCWCGVVPVIFFVPFDAVFAFFSLLIPAKMVSGAVLAARCSSLPLYLVLLSLLLWPLMMATVTCDGARAGTFEGSFRFCSVPRMCCMCVLRQCGRGTMVGKCRDDAERSACNSYRSRVPPVSFWV